LWVQINGHAAVGKGLIVSPPIDPCPAAIVIGTNVEGIQFDGLGIVFDGTFIVTLPQKNVAAVCVDNYDILNGKLARVNGLGVKPHGLV
jgi:hypothetical protein